MAKNHMPVAHFGVRPEDMRAECAPPKAFEKWQPEIGARAEADASEAGPFVIDIMDVIGETWDGYGITGRRIGALLRAAGDREVVVNINSPGGDVFEGLTIYNLLRGHKGEVTVRVVGLAASAASVIAMGGDRIEIARAGFLMIHNTWVFAIGDRHDLTTVADQLQAFDEVMADLYAQRSGIEAEKISTMMDRETWISGKTAIDQGFADELLPADQIAVSEKNREAAQGAKASIEFAFMARKAGYTRSAGIDLKNRLTAKPSAGEDGMPGAAESMAAFHRSVASFLGE